MKTVNVDNWKILVNIESESEEDLIKEAELKLQNHKRAGLKGRFLKDSLESVYPMEYWLDIQN